ncbi:MAG: Trm112 family protein [Thermoanaerobaculia bacterium]
MEDFQSAFCRLIYSRAMAVDQELLEILACPLCKEEVKLVPLTEARRAAVKDKFREKFRNEEPVVEEGLQCVKCHRVYPIVSDIPVMLVEEAFEES